MDRYREPRPGKRLLGRLNKLFTERKWEIAGVCPLVLTSKLFLALVTDRYQGQSKPIRLQSALVSNEH